MRYLKRYVETRVIAYRTYLQGDPMDAETMQKAEELEDELYHIGQALRALRGNK